MILQSSLKTYYKGTHRIISPQETKTGILKKIRYSKLPIYEKIKKIDRLDKIKIPVYAVIHNNKFHNCRLPSWGKGMTDDLAFVSALMERVERYSSSDVDARSGEIIYSDFESIKAQGAVSRWDLVPCNLQRKFYSKKEINRQKGPWVKCFSLTKKTDIFIPANLVFFNSGICKDDFSDTTGLASGNSIEEAVLHGLCEIIERHLQDTVHWNKIKIPAIDIGSVDDPGLRKLMDRFSSNGIKLHLSYLKSDFRIPVIRVFGYSEKPPYFGSYSFYTAIGVHPDKKVALSRALTEFAQSRVTGIYRIKYKNEKIQKFKFFPDSIYNFFNDPVDWKNVLSFKEIVNFENKDILKDIESIIDTLRITGCEVFIKDLTHPRINIPTVRVLVSNMQPGIFGIGIIDLNHKVARVSKHLNYYKYLIRNIKKIELSGN